MADPPNPSAISATFPAPPPFYKSFTPPNLERLHDIQEPPETDSARLPTPDNTLLPPKLSHLIPPPPPPKGEYRSFGELHSTLPLTLSTTTPSLPTPQRLTSLTHSLLLNFLSLVHLLATNPSAYGPKWDELRDLFLEAHRTVNEYRPHQARETLIMMMEGQVERCREETRVGRGVRERVKGVLGGLGVVPDAGWGGGGMREIGGGKNRGREEEEKRVWEVLEREVGGGGGVRV